MANMIGEILDFAIKEEEAAAQFYTDLAQQTDKTYMRDLFMGFAKEEMGHKEKLLKVKAGKFSMKPDETVTDLKIADYTVDIVPTPDMDYQEALLVAMKKEKAAFRMYTDLAAKADDPSIRETFLGLAQEEAKHKLRFEVEYDEYVLKEN